MTSKARTKMTMLLKRLLHKSAPSGETYSTYAAEVDPLLDTDHALRYANSGQIYQVPGNILRGKNGHVWSTYKDQSSHRTSAMNIVRTSGRPARMCRNVFDPKKIFDLFITDKILSEILRWTNVEIFSKRQKLGKNTATHGDVTASEIRAFIGILTLTAIMKDNHLSTDEMFDPTFSDIRDIFQL